MMERRVGAGGILYEKPASPRIGLVRSANGITMNANESKSIVPLLVMVLFLAIWTVVLPRLGVTT